MLKHILGSKMDKADGLSRKPDWEIGVEKDNKEQVLVKKKWLEIKRIRMTEVVIEGVDLLDKVRKYETKNNKVVSQMVTYLFVID